MTDTTIAKVILPLHRIPDGATVTKRTGEKPYLVKETLTVYNHDGTYAKGDEPQTIKTSGVRFLLCPRSGDINAHTFDLEVVWHVAPHEKSDMAFALGISAADCHDIEDYC